ncbi:MAG: hypothetical protein AAF715_11145 [Myxococcota bacterium]
MRRQVQHESETGRRNEATRRRCVALSWTAVAITIGAACGSSDEPMGPDDEIPIAGASSVGVGGPAMGGPTGGPTTGAGTGAGGAGGMSATTSSTMITVTTATAATGSGGAGGCVDNGVGEPNESEGTAWPLSGVPIEDCDGDGGMVSGTLGPGDFDWFTYEGDDVFMCVVDPTRSFTSSGPLRLCKFVACTDPNATTTFTCPSGTVDAQSAGGRAGCCGMAGFEIDDLDCTGTLDENAEVWVRIDRPSGTGCDSYTLSYHY